MQNRQNGRRRRGGGNNPRPMGQPMGGQGNNNRLEVKVRGNAHQLLEKYKVMARDAHQAGDRVATEYYLQHADHYFRVLNDSRIRQEELRARRGVFDPLDDDQDEDMMAPEGSEAEDAREQRSEQRQDQPSDQRQRGNRDDFRRREPQREQREAVEVAEAPAVEPVAAEAQAVEEAPEKPWPTRGRRRREPKESGVAVESGELPLSDGEAALVAFGGAARETAPALAPAAEEVQAEEDVKPRRRTRSRKVEAASAAES